MNAWLLLGIFVGLQLAVIIAGVFFYLGERNRDRRAAELVRFPWDDEAGA